MVGNGDDQVKDYFSLYYYYDDYFMPQV